MAQTLVEKIAQRHDAAFADTRSTHQEAEDALGRW